MKKHLSNIILILFFLVGLSLLLYPTLSNYYNTFHQSAAIATYMQDVQAVDNTSYEAYLDDAREYNKSLFGYSIFRNIADLDAPTYHSLLNLNNNGVMGFIEIPSINCSLPIYHGTDEAVLQIAVGHVGGSSLPVGGENTHCVLSGHRGLPSARLFTDIDRLVAGDIFMIYVMDEVLTYEVDQILIVLPNELDALEIVRGKDYCTLVTCTPYGINTHRLLVRGHRIENTPKAHVVRVSADAVQIDPNIVAPVVAAPMLLILLVVLLFTSGGKKSGNKKRK